ncbi:MAG: ATP-binding protein [Candidatus Pacearchaeota archaeon]
MINKEKWVEIIKDFHEKGIPWLIEREIAIPSEIPIKRAISIIGPRRAGKTYTMFQIIKKLIDKVKIKQVLYLNLERSDLREADVEDLNKLVESFFEIYPENKTRKIWFFLDEIQNVEGWEKFVRTLLDLGINVFISGSSSKFLSKEIATQLRGRTLSYEIFPFSFRDYLKAKNIEIKKYLSSREKATIIKEFRNYLFFGGYPEVVLYPEGKEKIISEIIETTIYRDVIERYKIKNIKLLRLLINSLISSATKEFSINKFYNFIKSKGIKASKNSLYNYLEALQDVFFVFQVKKFSYSYRKAEQSIPKIYFVDNGILTHFGIENKGKLMENLVFIELKRKGKEVYYWKNRYEVDFVIKAKREVERLIQVCYNINDIETKEREIKALLKASEELKCKNLLVITMDHDAEEKIKGKKIVFMPLWKWLLE